VRNNVAGTFWPDSRLRSLRCEVVERVPFDDLPGLLRAVRAYQGSEGAVVSWYDKGLMVKLKSTWWIALAAAQRKGSGQPAMALLSALQELPLSRVPSSLVWQAVLSGDDDQMSLVYGALPPAAQSSLRAFAAAVGGSSGGRGLAPLGEELREWALRVGEVSEADLAGVAGGWPVGLLACYLRRSPTAEQELRKFLAKLAVAGQVAALEALLGCAWGGGEEQAVEVCGHLGSFDRAPADVVAHVLETYLPRKLADYLGHPVDDQTPVRVERLHEPSEGKLKGLWEEFASQGIIDLRVDLQPRAKVYDGHNGDADFAHWQVQFGPNDNCPRSTKARAGDRCGAFAGVLLRTGMDIDYGQVRDAFELSFQTHKVVKLDPSPTRISQIFVDLDGVLADFDAGFGEAFGGSAPSDAKTRWQHIEKTPGFFESLPWADGGRRLWRHVCQTGLPVTILSGVPEGSALGERSAGEKKRWVARELGPDVEVITCLSREKPLHSGHGRLLIDDRVQEGWEGAGGRQIRHRSVFQTLGALAELGLGSHFAAPRDKVIIVDTLTDDLAEARAQAEVVAIDVEWRPDKAGASPNPAALLQLAFRPSPRWMAFVIDVLSWDEQLKAFIRDLLSSSLPKLVFGPGDADRLGMQITAATDLQKGHESLAAQARKVGLLLSKSKHLQACDWSARPLRDEQVVYAATDALVLLELAGGVAAAPIRQARSTGQAATVEFTGVFLSPDSRQKLLRRVPPCFAQVAGDHMTIAWKPESVKGLAVGKTVKLRVEASACEDGVQAVAVTTMEAQARPGHVTVSHKADVPAKNSNHLVFEDLQDPFVVEGVLGVSVILQHADQEQLPTSVRERVHRLVESQPGRSEQFEGLTDGQRHALHVVADELGLEHRSEGKKGTRYRKLILTVPKKPKAILKPKTTGERVVVKDQRKFAALFGDAPGQHLHGRMQREGVVWEPGVTIPPALEHALSSQGGSDLGFDHKLAVILRGFPGCGKSSLASCLQRQIGMVLASADDFFTGIGDIQEAHDQCRQVFMQALKSQRPVVVDNTNVRRGDYSFYSTKAEAQGYTVVVLEFVCESTADLERMRARSVHSVPGGAVGGMWARWEQDPSSLKIAPYMPLELLQWVREMGMINRQPNTHLVMPRGPFFSVAASARAEFHERFAREWGRHPISEQGCPRGFRLFFDVDGLDLERLLPALQPLHSLVGSRLVVTGTCEPPAPGYHIFAPERVVDAAGALALRRRWLELVPALEGYVDGQVYKAPQLRLLGSRKVSKDGVDLGRVHAVVGRLDADGGWREAAAGDADWSWSEVSILP